MISKILLYFIAISFGLVFALYMSASVGWTFVYVLVCAPIFSFIVTFAIHKLKCVTIRADVSRSMLYKREKAVLRIYLKNKSLLPVPSVKITLSGVKNLLTEDSLNYIVSIPPRMERVIEVNYTAKVWGVCSIGAEKAVLNDFMGFFHFAMPCMGASCEIKIFPDVPEIPGDAPLLRSAAEAAKFADDNEETKESDGIVKFGGMPGYTHKEYEDGDPVRRINWKLSSKRDKYMVRLDDEVESIQQTIVLDACGGSDVLLNERAVEGMLAAALGLIKCGFDTTVCCRFNGIFTQFEIGDPADISELQTRMADYRFEGQTYKGERIPTDLIAGKGILLYTSFLDSKLSAEISSAEGQGIAAVVIAADNSFSESTRQVWRLNEDYSAELVG